MSTPSPLSMSTSPSAPRLSARRRGSMAAPDPYGTLLVQDNDERGMSSILTITRAPPTLNADQDAEERASRRRRSVGSHARTRSGGSGRISFAFAAFSPKENARSGSVESDGPPSPSSHHAAPRSNSFTALGAHSPLTPHQVYDLAQQCNYPNSQPPTPGGGPSLATAPVTFTPLSDTIHLPFLDRPKEVQTLMSIPPTSTMFSLLAQIFPLSSPPSLDADPKHWTYEQLEQWLTKVDREQADDVKWVHKARECITARSELIWERVKGALGVPPELDAPPPAPSKPEAEDAHPEIDEPEDSFNDAWVEPIVSNSTGLPSRPHSHSPTDMRRSPSLGRQSISRMEDISEDAPSPTSMSPPPALHGLRVVTSPASPPVRRESSPLPTSAGSFSHPHLPYDIAAERGPGHPLFPSSFANLALGPTLVANNPSLRSPSVPPASAYPLMHYNTRRKLPSWAEEFDPQKQEYAVSLASGSSRRSVPVE